MVHPAPVQVSLQLYPEETATDGSNKKGASICDRIARILGHADRSKLNMKSKLTELGMDSVMAMEARQVIEEDFGLSLSGQDLRRYTLEQLEEISLKKKGNNQGSSKSANTVTDKIYSPTSGLFQLNFLRNRSSENFFPTNCTVSINKAPRQSGKGSVFICTSFEGADACRVLGSLIPIPMYAMQLSVDAPLDNIPSLADFYIKNIKDVEPEGPYTIVGYSAGVVVAFEVAHKLFLTGEVNRTTNV